MLGERPFHLFRGQPGVRQVGEGVASELRLFAGGRPAEGDRHVACPNACPDPIALSRADVGNVQGAALEGELGKAEAVVLRGDMRLDYGARFEATGVRPSFINRLEAAGIKLPSNLFQERILLRD